MYANGRGVTQDFAEAVKLYKEAADQGYAVAQDNLGIMYNEGHGVPQDLAEAVKWWRKAAEQGNASAQDHLAAQQVRTAPERGYKRITFDDFMLDGKELAASGAKVSIQGVYVNRARSRCSFLHSRPWRWHDRRLARTQASAFFRTTPTRSARKFLLDCRNSPIGAQLGCSLTVVGRVDMCKRTTLVGSTDMPCLIVEDGASATTH